MGVIKIIWIDCDSGPFSDCESLSRIQCENWFHNCRVSYVYFLTIGLTALLRSSNVLGIRPGKRRSYAR